MALPTSILSMFARSPIRPLQQHMQKANHCTQLLMPFFQAVIKNDWQQAQHLQNQISEAEREADVIKMDFRSNLPKSLFLPVARTDLLELLSKQESIANTAKDIAGIVLGREMTIPQSLQKVFTTYLELALNTSEQANRAVSELDELFESGFSGKEIDIVDDMVQQLNQSEHETDQIQIEVRSLLFKLEKDLQPIDIMFLYEITGLVGDLADNAEKVGNRLRMLVAS